MKIVEVNSTNKSIINDSNRQTIIDSFLNTNTNNQNDIHSCIIGIESDTIKNYALYTGMKDTRLVQMSIENINNKIFLEQAVNYAFQNLDAYTVTIFTDKPNKLLETEGFENLGSDNNIYTYIKDREIQKDVGRVRI